MREQKSLFRGRSAHRLVPYIAIGLFFLAAALLFYIFFTDAAARWLWADSQPALAAFFVRNDPDLAMEIGNYYFNGGAYDLTKSLASYEKAVVANPKILWGHYQIARILFVDGKFNDALSEINQELVANPENLRSLYVRGLIYGYRGQPGDLELAEKDFRDFTFWAPTEWAGYNDLAWILSKEKKYADTETAMAAALREVPDGQKNPWLWNALGVAKLNLSDYKGAQEAFQNALPLAEVLTLDDWRKSYPGNDPQSAVSGRSQFIDAIKENLRRAQVTE